MIKLAGRVAELESSQTIRLDAQAKELLAAGKPVINLTAGELDWEPPEVILQAAERAIRAGENHYSAPQGLLAARAAARDYFKMQRGLEYDIDQIIITNGAKQALYSAITTLVNPGDEVLVMLPAWVSYIEQLRLAGGIPVGVETDEQFSVSRSGLEAALTPQTTGMIVNSPNNPTGAVYAKDQLEMMADFAATHGLWVISDEIYDRLVYDEMECHSVAEFYPAGTVVVNGVSKSGAMTGWRVGCAAGPTEIIVGMQKLQSHLAGNVCNIAQLAAGAAFSLTPSDLQPMLDELARRRKAVVDWAGVNSRVSLVSPRGAFYCFLNISRVSGDSERFCERLLAEQNVALVPGKYFGRDGFVRLSFANSYDRIVEALGRIDNYINVHVANGK